MEHLNTSIGGSVALATDVPRRRRRLPKSFGLGPQAAGCLPTMNHSAGNWLWQGYLAPGKVTLLTSQWKTGKTTLLAALLKQLDQGGQLAGLDVRASRSIVMSEESPELWRERNARLDLGQQARFFCRPFPTKPTRRQWRAMIAYLDELRVAQGLDLLVLDTLPSFLPPGAESHADLMLRMLKRLEPLTQAGVAVLLLHHPRKGPVQSGQAARGTGALAGYADVIIEMRMLQHAARDDRRRRLSAWSRLHDTPHERVIELTPSGDQFTACHELVDEEQHVGLQMALQVLARDNRRMSRDEILREWPERRKPPRGTLFDWLERAISAGTLLRHGTGRRGDPYLYMYPTATLDAEDLINDSLNEIFNRKWS